MTGRLLQLFALFALFWALAQTGCSQRPKWHHPQPEASSKAQCERVFFGMLDAYLSGDAERYMAYFPERWQLLDGASVAGEIDRAEARDLFMKRLQALSGPPPSAAELIDWERLVVASAYDLDDMRFAVDFGDRAYKNLLGAHDIIVIVPLLPERSAKAGLGPRLVVVFSRRDGKWLVRAIE